ncbi:MAG TPA: phosphopantothenoylcysteine decarboxylase [Phycisphaerales bacterium]|nr:phosphopantothenoylcysteine decarboxylase [Phycisphaerales bacterium]
MLGKTMLITAGPTHEPIDAVRYIANRSSGRLGIALAAAGAERGWGVTLLLGPTHLACEDSRVRTVRFRTTEELRGLLAEHFPKNRVLIQAAAVADYRVRGSGTGDQASGSQDGHWKIKRAAEGLTLELEATPDLVAGCAAARKPGQVIVGFALEPREVMVSSAREKLSRKGLDLVVANPLETMDSGTIEAVVVSRGGGGGEEMRTDGVWAKERFAEWLVEHLATL